ncbi:cyclase [Thermoleptolyngbya sichuanensis A183]|uniref:Cyclase n=2 Tax=Thermoleptolyngbya TaxID=2303528 RepID=A0A6M8BIF4_9CYAN|nr:cyclase [Thermoleptolyngbya sichuanensis A183]
MSNADLDLETLDLEDESLDLEPSLCSAVAVEVVPVGDRTRQISATIQIPQPSDRIWQVLTDYEHLSDFIPNLQESRRIPHPDGGIRIEQVGAQSLWKLKLKFCARVVLDMVENFPRELRFQMVEGDFKEFFGAWTLQPITDSSTNLTYTLMVQPSRMMPVGLIEKRLRRDLEVNLAAIYQRVEAIARQS